jgi:hypothetical protein
MDRAGREQGFESPLFNILQVAVAYKELKDPLLFKDHKFESRSVFSSRLLAHLHYWHRDYRGGYFTMGFVSPFRFLDLLTVTEMLMHLGRPEAARDLFLTINLDAIVGDPVRLERFETLLEKMKKDQGDRFDLGSDKQQYLQTIREGILSTRGSEFESIYRTCNDPD